LGNGDKGVKLKFGRGAQRLFEVNKNTDFFLDNGACIQLITKDRKKEKFERWEHITSFRFPKGRFKRLLKDEFIKISNIEYYDEIIAKRCPGWKIDEKNSLYYYIFTDKINEFKEEFI
jgi:hypothetical protein